MRALLAALSRRQAYSPAAHQKSMAPVPPPRHQTEKVTGPSALTSKPFEARQAEASVAAKRAANNARIYRLSEPPRRSGQPVVYSLDPTGKASWTGLAAIGGDDGSLSVASARNQCAAARILRKTY